MDANAVEISALVTKSKAARLDKLIQINKANIAILAQEIIFGQALEAAHVDGFKDKYFHYFEKGRLADPLLDELAPDPNNGVQSASCKII